jgi:alpha-1,3-rhamnosyl/mannosyltransferase
MHIALNATALLSPLTGIGQYVWHLAHEMAEQGEVKAHYYYGAKWSDQLRTGAPAAASRWLPRLRKAIPFAYELRHWVQTQGFRQQAKKRGCQIYHEPNYLALPFDGPLVLTVHDLSWIRYPHAHPKERVQAMDKYFEPSLRRAQRIITDSVFVQRELQDVFGIDPARIQPIALGVESLFHPRNALQTKVLLDRLQLQHGAYFLAVGTLEPRKNLVNALRAYQRLPSALRERMPLVLAGMKGWHTEALEKEMAPLVAQGQLRQPGYLAREDLATLVAGARALVFPSIYEGFGLPLVEAMASGVPVLTSNVSSLPEVAQDAGLLFDPLDEVAIAQAMLTLAQDDDLHARLATRALALAPQYTWEKCARKTVQVYRDVL